MTEKLKILHLTVKRHLTSGQRKQLSSELRSSGEIDGVEWHTLAYHITERKEDFEKPIPFPLSLLLLRPLFAWLLLLKIKSDYDAILVRHMPFDPFALVFAPLIKNRMPVHHAKATEELHMIAPGLRGKIAARVESVTGRSSAANALAVLGVTRELGEYECKLFGLNKPHFHYPNGMHPDEVALAPDKRDDTHCHVAFLCGKFSPWQGLDRLVEAVDLDPDRAAKLTIHLIGEVDDIQRRDIAGRGLSDTIIAHGFMQNDDYRRLLAKADVSIGSLGMDRRGMREGALLKIRESLAAGIPVISGHPDTAIPIDLPFHRVIDQMRLDDLLEFAIAMKRFSREEVRAQSLPYIEKAKSMRDLVMFLLEQKLVSAA